MQYILTDYAEMRIAARNFKSNVDKLSEYNNNILDDINNAYNTRFIVGGAEVDYITQFHASVHLVNYNMKTVLSGLYDIAAIYSSIVDMTEKADEKAYKKINPMEEFNEYVIDDFVINGVIGGFGSGGGIIAGYIGLADSVKSVRLTKISKSTIGILKDAHDISKDYEEGGLKGVFGFAKEAKKPEKFSDFKDIKKGGVDAAFAITSILADVACTIDDNYHEYKRGEISAGRAIMETVSEYVVDNVLDYGFKTLGFVVAGPLGAWAAPAVTSFVKNGLDWLSNKLFKKDLTEFISDGILDIGEAVVNGAVKTGKAIYNAGKNVANAIGTGVKKVANGIGNFFKNLF